MMLTDTNLVGVNLTPFEAQVDNAVEWIRQISQSYVSLDCVPLVNRGFYGAIENCTLPGIDISVVKSHAQEVHRTEAHIDAADEQFFLVSIQVKGCGHIAQDGREAVLMPGMFALYQSSRPYRLTFKNRFEQIVLKLRRAELLNVVSEPEQMTARAISGKRGAGLLFLNGVKALLDTPANTQVTKLSANAMSDSLINLLAAGLYSLPNIHSIEVPALHEYHLSRIKEYIESNLHNSQLSLDMIAAELDVSVSLIHRVFSSEVHTPVQYIWEQRLQRAKRHLVSAQFHHETISSLAYRCGFNDAAHFSRAFRARFGVTASDWKKSAGIPSLSELDTDGLEAAKSSESER